MRGLAWMEEMYGMGLGEVRIEAAAQRGDSGLRRNDGQGE